MKQQINKLIDHTNLKSDATKENIKQLCKEAVTWNFQAVCLNPSYVKFAAVELLNTEIKICTVVGFPLGAVPSETKVFEARNAVEHGAHEIDMVINIGALKEGDYTYVLKELREVINASKPAPVKVIIETYLLTEAEKRDACKLVMDAGASFVKTSTGFAGGGATAEDVALLKSIVGEKVKIKASGGIKNKDKLMEMVRSGADRIGTSSGVQIMESIK